MTNEIDTLKDALADVLKLGNELAQAAEEYLFVVKRPGLHSKGYVDSRREDVWEAIRAWRNK